MIWEPGELRTARLLLRTHRADDAADLLEFHSDAAVVRYIPWPVRTLDEVRQTLATKRAQDRVTAPGQVLVLAIEFEQHVVGEVLLKARSERIAELGYALNRSYWGRGFASEAATAMLALAFDTLGVDEVTATLDARNAASARLLERLGMRLVGSAETEFKGEQITELEYAIDRPAHAPAAR